VLRQVSVSKNTTAVKAKHFSVVRGVPTTDHIFGPLQAKYLLIFCKLYEVSCLLYGPCLGTEPCRKILQLILRHPNSFPKLILLLNFVF